MSLKKIAEGQDTKAPLPTGKNVERKRLPTVAVIMIMSENEGSISFPRSYGNVDFASFFGSDPSFMRYVTDLFLYYWDQAKNMVLGRRPVFEKDQCDF